MGKKRVIKKTAETQDAGKATTAARSRKKLSSGIIHILSTYNNTLITLTDEEGDVYLTASAGRSGFSGSKKGTPYAASKAAEHLADQARDMGLQEVSIRVRGVGSGRESALRVFGQKGFVIHSIKDATPIPHGFLKPTKPRRV
ncbi:MAG: 30S ribosomal protein S11 [Candidatus Ryanbacteria bacterium]|nr:30S ribosomal protein S11 [Candidatus Ryanbacteria bacterium]